MFSRFRNIFSKSKNEKDDEPETVTETETTNSAEAQVVTLPVEPVRDASGETVKTTKENGDTESQKLVQNIVKKVSFDPILALAKDIEEIKAGTVITLENSIVETEIVDVVELIADGEGKSEIVETELKETATNTVIDENPTKEREDHTKLNETGKKCEPKTVVTVTFVKTEKISPASSATAHVEPVDQIIKSKEAEQEDIVAPSQSIDYEKATEVSRSNTSLNVDLDSPRPTRAHSYELLREPLSYVEKLAKVNQSPILTKKSLQKPIVQNLNEEPLKVLVKQAVSTGTAVLDNISVDIDFKIPEIGPTKNDNDAIIESDVVAAPKEAENEAEVNDTSATKKSENDDFNSIIPNGVELFHNTETVMAADIINSILEKALLEALANNKDLLEEIGEQTTSKVDEISETPETYICSDEEKKQKSDITKSIVTELNEKDAEKEVIGPDDEKFELAPENEDLFKDNNEPIHLEFDEKPQSHLAYKLKDEYPSAIQTLAPLTIEEENELFDEGTFEASEPENSSPVVEKDPDFEQQTEEADVDVEFTLPIFKKTSTNPTPFNSFSQAVEDNEIEVADIGAEFTIPLMKKARQETADAVQPCEGGVATELTNRAEVIEKEKTDLESDESEAIDIALTLPFVKKNSTEQLESFDKAMPVEIENCEINADDQPQEVATNVAVTFTLPIVRKKSSDSKELYNPSQALNADVVKADILENEQSIQVKDCIEEPYETDDTTVWASEQFDSVIDLQQLDDADDVDVEFMLPFIKKITPGSTEILNDTKEIDVSSLGEITELQTTEPLQEETLEEHQAIPFENASSTDNNLGVVEDIETDFVDVDIKFTFPLANRNLDDFDDFYSTPQVIDKEEDDDMDEDDVGIEFTVPLARNISEAYLNISDSIIFKSDDTAEANDAGKNLPLVEADKTNRAEQEKRQPDYDSFSSEEPVREYDVETNFTDEESHKMFEAKQQFNEPSSILLGTLEEPSTDLRTITEPNALESNTAEKQESKEPNSILLVTSKEHEPSIDLQKITEKNDLISNIEKDKENEELIEALQQPSELQDPTEEFEQNSDLVLEAELAKPEIDAKLHGEDSQESVEALQQPSELQDSTKEIEQSSDFVPEAELTKSEIDTTLHGEDSQETFKALQQPSKLQDSTKEFEQSSDFVPEAKLTKPEIDTTLHVEASQESVEALQQPSNFQDSTEEFEQNSVLVLVAELKNPEIDATLQAEGSKESVEALQQPLKLQDSTKEFEQSSDFVPETELKNPEIDAILHAEDSQESTEALQQPSKLQDSTEELEQNSDLVLEAELKKPEIDATPQAQDSQESPENSKESDLLKSKVKSEKFKNIKEFIEVAEVSKDPKEVSETTDLDRRNILDNIENTSKLDASRTMHQPIETSNVFEVENTEIEDEGLADENNIQSDISSKTTDLIQTISTEEEIQEALDTNKELESTHIDAKQDSPEPSSILLSTLEEPSADLRTITEPNTISDIKPDVETAVQSAKEDDELYVADRNNDVKLGSSVDVVNIESTELVDVTEDCSDFPQTQIEAELKPEHDVSLHTESYQVFSENDTQTEAENKNLHEFDDDQKQLNEIDDTKDLLQANESSIAPEVVSNTVDQRNLLDNIETASKLGSTDRTAKTSDDPSNFSEKDIANAEDMEPNPFNITIVIKKPAQNPASMKVFENSVEDLTSTETSMQTAEIDLTKTSDVGMRESENVSRPIKLNLDENKIQNSPQEEEDLEKAVEAVILKKITDSNTESCEQHEGSNDTDNLQKTETKNDFEVTINSLEPNAVPEKFENSDNIKVLGAANLENSNKMERDFVVEKINEPLVTSVNPNTPNPITSVQNDIPSLSDNKTENIISDNKIQIDNNKSNNSNNSSVMSDDLNNDVTSPSTDSGNGGSELNTTGTTDPSTAATLTITPTGNNAIACNAISNKLSEISEVAESLDAVIRDVQEDPEGLVETNSTDSSNDKKQEIMHSNSSEDWHSRSTEDESFATASEGGNFTPHSHSSSFQTASGRTSSFISSDKNSFDASEADDSTFAFDIPDIPELLTVPHNHLHNISLDSSDHSFRSAQHTPSPSAAEGSRVHLIPIDIEPRSDPEDVDHEEDGSAADIEELHSQSVTPTPGDNHFESIPIESEHEWEHEAAANGGSGASCIADAPSMEILTELTPMTLSMTPEVSNACPNASAVNATVFASNQLEVINANTNKPNAAWRRNKYYENITKQTIKGFL